MHFSVRSVCLVSAAIILIFNSAECKAGPVASVNFIFETFSPYGLVKFFEFSDKGWNISENCLKDMYSFLEGLQLGSVWAVKLYDSIHYYSGNAFSGNRYRIESAAQCRQLQAEYLSILKMHWSLKTNTTAVPFALQLINAKYEIEMNYKVFEIFTIQQSICFPSACNANDLEQILITTAQPDERIIKNTTLISLRTLEGSYDIYQDDSFYSLTSMLAVALILTTFSYLYERFSKIDNDIAHDKKSSDADTSSLPSDLSIDDLECAIEQLSKLGSCDKNSLTKVNMHHSAECMTINNMNSNNHVNLVKVKKVKTRNSATISLDIIAGNCKFAKANKRQNLITSRGPFWKLLISFSWRLNFENLTKRTSSEFEISTIRGLQVLCTVLILLGHTCAVMEYLSNNRHALSPSTYEFLKFVKGHSTYLIDMFFFLSGANLTYLYFKTSVQGKCNVLEQIIHFVAMITYKICSIILSYIVILICLELTAKYLNSNSALDIPSFDHTTCQSDKWLNVLYIDKFFPLTERCMLWSWFISIEVNFFIAACLVLLLAQIHPKYAGAICTGIFISSLMAATFVEIDTPHFIDVVKQTVEHDLMEFNMMFDQIWVRIPPYLLGMCLGYTLYKTCGKFEINVFVLIFGWIACVFILIGFGYGFQTIVFRINPWVQAIVTTLGHTIWSMVLFWITLASISQYGVDDATGHYTSGFFYGNNYWMGSLSLCTSIYNPDGDGKLEQVKKNEGLPFAHVSSIDSGNIRHNNPPFVPGFYVLKVIVNDSLIAPSSRTVHIGICLPSTCSLNDIEKLTVFSQQSIVTREMKILSVRSPTNRIYDMWSDTTFIILVIVSTVVFVLLIIGTTYDIILLKRYKKVLNQSHTESLANSETSSGIGCTTYDLTDVVPHDLKKDLTVDIQLPHSINNNNSDEHLANELQDPRRVGILSEILLSFSVITNFNAICDRSVGSDTIPSIHGLRAISMAWVILGHTCIVVFKYSDNMELRKVVEKNFLFQTITNGAFSVDTFFFISGFLVSYIYFRTNAKGKLEKLSKGVSEITAGTYHFLGLVGYRFVRLTAPYLFVLGVVEVSMKHMETTSVFDPPTMDHVNCPKYWWRNVLYINTLFPVEDMCMLWSWYLANDTQFYIIGAIILIIAVRHFKFAASTLAVFMVSSWITTGFIAFSNNHMPNTDDPLALFDKIYDKPWTRLGPYLVGMSVGWILFKTNCKIRMNRMTVILGWTMSIGCLLLLIFGLYNANLSLIVAATYSSLSHSAWALSLAWITIACSTGYGGYVNSLLSASCIYPFSRVTYCAYLVHPIVIRSLALNSDAPLHLGTDSMVITFFGLVVCSYLLSFIVSISFEAPVVTMLKIMSPNRQKRTA